MTYAKTVRVENREGNSLFIDNNPASDEKLMILLKEALNHKVIFQDGYNFIFAVEWVFGNLAATFPAAAPMSLMYFVQFFKEKLREHGHVTLYQDDFYVNR